MRLGAAFLFLALGLGKAEAGEIALPTWNASFYLFGGQRTTLNLNPYGYSDYQAKQILYESTCATLVDTVEYSRVYAGRWHQATYTHKANGGLYYSVSEGQVSELRLTVTRNDGYSGPCLIRVYLFKTGSGGGGGIKPRPPVDNADDIESAAQWVNIDAGMFRLVLAQKVAGQKALLDKAGTLERAAKSLQEAAKAGMSQRDLERRFQDVSEAYYQLEKAYEAAALDSASVAESWDTLRKAYAKLSRL